MDDAVVAGELHHRHGVEVVDMEGMIEKELNDSQLNMAGPIVGGLDLGGVCLDVTLEFVGEEWPEYVGVGLDGLGDILAESICVLVSAIAKRLEALHGGVGLAFSIAGDIDNDQPENV